MLRWRKGVRVVRRGPSTRARGTASAPHGAGGSQERRRHALDAAALSLRLPLARLGISSNTRAPLGVLRGLNRFASLPCERRLSARRRYDVASLRRATCETGVWAMALRLLAAPPRRARLAVSSLEQAASPQQTRLSSDLFGLSIDVQSLGAGRLSSCIAVLRLCVAELAGIDLKRTSTPCLFAKALRTQATSILLSAAAL
jgi:hypothetical protein